MVLNPKQSKKSAKFRFIAVCSYYYPGPNNQQKHALYDHITEAYNILLSKYGEGIELILSADSNKLDLSPILDISPSLSQVVKVPTCYIGYNHNNDVMLL